MDISSKEIVLLMSGNESLNKQTIAHAQSLKHPVNVQEQLEGITTSTLYSLILENSDMEPKHLLDRSSSYYQDELRGKDLTREEWIHVLQQHPELLRAPVGLRGKKVVVCDNPSNVQSLDS